MRTRYLVVSGLLTLAVAAVGLGIADVGMSGAGEGCGPRTLKGSYVYALSGFKTGGETAAQRTPFGQAGREMFNGDGTMSGVGTASFNGKTARTTYKGTYTMNADCSGTVTFTDNQGQASNYDIFADHGGASFTYVQTDAAIVSAGWERRE